MITLLEHARHRLVDQSLVEGAGRARRPTAIRELSRRSTLLKHLNGLISCAPAFQVTSIEECRTEAECEPRFALNRDTRGRVESLKDEAGRSIHYKYDGDSGRIVSVRAASGSPERPSGTRGEYDREGRLTAAIDSQIDRATTEDEALMQPARVGKRRSADDELDSALQMTLSLLDWVIRAQGYRSRERGGRELLRLPGLSQEPLKPLLNVERSAVPDRLTGSNRGYT